MEDGAFFGEVTLVTGERLHIASIIAASICELYCLDRRDFVLCIEPYPPLYERIKSIALDRRTETVNADKASKESRPN